MSEDAPNYGGRLARVAPRQQMLMPADDNGGLKWFNSPTTFREGTLADIGQHIPAFERRAFALTQPGGGSTRLNTHLDTVVRLPFGDDKDHVPVGVVSKSYVLVPHADVLKVACQALIKAKIEPADTKAELEITEYGERIALSLYLPDAYQFTPSDGYKLAPRLELFNSVDGSSRFRALMGWFRFVCSNGLIVGVTRSDMHRRHVGGLNLEDIGAVLTSGLKESETEKKNFEKWHKTPITLNRLEPWADDVLRTGWGFKAAARTLHIAQTGHDAEVVGSYTGSTPTKIAMRETTPVPGAPAQCGNLFNLSQILAWLAKERRDIQEQLEWREKIPDLLEPLRN